MDKKERFITKNKAAFKKRYGADWERVLYSTANKMFKEEHGAGDWGTDKLTNKYLKDTPGQEESVVKNKKVVLKKKAVEEEKPAETKKPQPDNKGYAERRAAAKKAKQDKMDRMVRARLAGGPPRKNRGAFWRQEKSIGESVEVTESDKAEYNKLMDKYGDMPMSKVPMKARLRIRELGRSVRGDKGGPTAGDLVKSMKRRRMGEEVEQVGEAVDGWIAMYNGKKVEIKKSEAKDLYAAKLKAIQMLKVPKSKQGLLAIKPAVNEEVEQVDEVKSKAARMMKKDKAARRRGEQEVDSVIKQSPEDQKQREKNIQKGIDRMVQLGKDVRAGRKPKMSPARAKLHGEEVEQVDEISRKTAVSALAKAMTQDTLDNWSSSQYHTGPVHGRLEKRRAGKLRNRVRSRFGDKVAKDAEKRAKLLMTKHHYGTPELKNREKRAKERDELKKSDRTKMDTRFVKDPLAARKSGTKINKSGKVNKKDTEWLKNQIRRNVDDMRWRKSVQTPPNYDGKKVKKEEVEVAEAGMIGRTKPSRELNVQKDEKPHLAGVKSLKYQKRAAHKAERKKGKQDVKINPTVEEETAGNPNMERARLAVKRAAQRKVTARQKLAQARVRELAKKRRKMGRTGQMEDVETVLERLTGEKKAKREKHRVGGDDRWGNRVGSRDTKFKLRRKGKILPGMHTKGLRPEKGADKSAKRQHARDASRGSSQVQGTSNTRDPNHSGPGHIRVTADPLHKAKHSRPVRAHKLRQARKAQKQGAKDEKKLLNK